MHGEWNIMNMKMIIDINKYYYLKGGYIMLQFIISNLATIIITLLLITIVSFIIRKMIKDKKQGKSCCSGGCAGCSKSSCQH